jgi:hypothetical protein
MSPVRPKADTSICQLISFRAKVYQSNSAGAERLVSRQAHNLKVASSNLAPATKKSRHVSDLVAFFFLRLIGEERRVNTVSTKAVSPSGSKRR